MKLSNDEINIETECDDKSFTILLTQETDFSHDGGYSFETQTNGGTLDFESAALLLSELQVFTESNPYTVDATHTDPTQIKTALALAERKLARAEKLNKVMYNALVLIASDRNSPPILAGTWEKTSKKWQTAWNLVTNIAKSTIELLTDKQLEDVLMSGKGGDK